MFYLQLHQHQAHVRAVEFSIEPQCGGGSIGSVCLRVQNQGDLAYTHLMHYRQVRRSDTCKTMTVAVSVVESFGNAPCHLFL
jgi:hypothetical protein